MARKAQGAFRTISEVADWLDIPAHVLRFWESKFSQIKPVKRAGGRRYYRPEDMLLIGGIKKLLHDDGLTIRGVQKMLKEDGIKEVSTHSQELDMPTDEEAARRRVARRARRKERAARAKAAKPPLVPDTPAQAPEETEESPKPMLTIATPGQTPTPSPDNVVPMPTREDPLAEPDEPEAEEIAESDTPEPVDAPEIEEVAGSIDEQPALDLTEADPEPVEENTAPASTVEEEIAVVPEVELDETPDVAPQAMPAEAPPLPDVASIALSNKAIENIDAIKALRRSDPDSIRNKAVIRTLHDRLSDLRARMGDG